jgi:hypothetical protein
MITLGRVSLYAPARVLAGQVVLEEKRLLSTVTGAHGVSGTIAASRTRRPTGSTAKAPSGPTRRSVADPGGAGLLTGTGQASAQTGALPGTSMLLLPLSGDVAADVPGSEVQAPRPNSITERAGGVRRGLSSGPLPSVGSDGRLAAGPR